MKKYLLMAVAAIGMLASGFATAGCVMIIFDEPKMPKSLIK